MSKNEKFGDFKPRKFNPKKNQEKVDRPGFITPLVLSGVLFVICAFLVPIVDAGVWLFVAFAAIAVQCFIAAAIVRPLEAIYVLLRDRS